MYFRNKNFFVIVFILRNFLRRFFRVCKVSWGDILKYYDIVLNRFEIY